MLCLSPTASSAHLVLSGSILYRECSRRRAIPCLFWHEAIFWHWQLEASTLQLKAGDECKSVSDSTIDTHINFFQTKVTDSEEFLRADISWAWLGPYWVLEIKPQDELSSLADTAVDFCPCHLTEQSGTQRYHWIMISCLLFFSSAPHVAKCTIFPWNKTENCPPSCSLPHTVGLNGKHQHRITRCTKNGSGFPDRSKPRFGSYHCCTRHCPSSGLIWGYLLQ